MAEFSVIAQYFTRPLQQEGDLGVGDDSAIITPPPHHQLIICTDTLVAGRHFPIQTSPYAIGWKSVAVNLSDIAAMGAKPHSILLALSLPEVNHAWLSEFSRGLYDCCDQFNVKLIGGDTTQNPQLTLTVTALGYAEQGKAICRSGANVGDYIIVSGQLGDAAYALLHQNSSLQHRLDCPTPRCELGQSLVGFASSMIDISDGLVQDLGHILEASNVGATLHLNHLPVDTILETLPNQEKWQYALSGGDDYELCFTMSPDLYTQFLQHLSHQKIEINTLITKIGVITSEKTLSFEFEGQAYPLHLKGYQHFV